MSKTKHAAAVFKTAMNADEHRNIKCPKCGCGLRQKNPKFVLPDFESLLDCGSTVFPGHMDKGIIQEDPACGIIAELKQHLSQMAASRAEIASSAAENAVEMTRLDDELKRLRKLIGEWADSVATCQSPGAIPHCGVTCCDCIAADMWTEARTADQPSSERAKPETCRWTWGPLLGWQSQCRGMIQDSGQAPAICTSCGGKVEAWDVDGKRIEQAGKAEGRQG